MTEKTLGCAVRFWARVRGIDAACEARAVSAHDGGLTQRATRNLLRAVRYGSRSPLVYRMLGDDAWSRSDFQAAERWYQKAQALHGRASVLHARFFRESESGTALHHTAASLVLVLRLARIAEALQDTRSARRRMRAFSRAIVRLACFHPAFAELSSWIDGQIPRARLAPPLWCLADELGDALHVSHAWGEVA